MATISPTEAAALSRARRALWIIVAIAVLGALGFLAAGWHYSGQIESVALIVDHEPEPFDLRVASIAGGRVNLESTEATDADSPWRRPGLWGLATETTYNHLGEVIDSGEGFVARELIPLGPLPNVGAPARVDAWAYAGDPLTAHGIEFQEIGIPGSLGTFPAWLTMGASDDWAILVHGKGADRPQALRILPILVNAGLSTLTITYRNDEGLPASPSGYYQYGLDEWEDLEAAATFALAAGARDIVLVGYSMGGGIALNFLYHSSVAARIKGLVLLAPTTNFDALVDHGASQRSFFGVPLPGTLTDLAKTIAALRFGLDMQGMNYLKRVDELDAPMLLIQETDDERVPVRLSEQLAEARSDLVEYHVFEGAAHVSAWNHDAERFEAILREFLDELD